MTTGERLAAELRRAWNGDPWHGPSVAEVLSRLSARQASGRRAAGSHTPWELVRHLTVWVETPLRRFDDPARDIGEEENFAAPAVTTDEQWRADVAALGDVVERLARRVVAMTDAALDAPVGERGYSHAFMVDGIVQHLAYHGGQIAILARPEETAGVVAPPVVIAIAAMLAAEAARLAMAWPLHVAPSFGAAVALGGMGLIWWAYAHFVRARTPAEPWRATRAVVHGGPYRLTRNPMYVGLLVAQAGIGLMRGNAWYLVMLVPAWLTLHWGVVRREERYLLKRFGAPYQQLLDTTRRWLW
jgi:protein-S-isoprenylcysteine O-methyltransferase Ste14